MNKITKLLLTIIAAAWLPCSAANANDDSPVDNKSTFNISHQIDLVFARDIQYAKPHVMIKMVFPRLVDEAAKSHSNSTDDSSYNINVFNEEVARLLKEEIDHFKKRVADSQNFQKKVEASKIRNRLTIDYNSAIINLEDKPIISIRFIIQGYITGMTHPYHLYRTVNFDLEAGKVMQLSDLFLPDSNYMQVLTQYADNELTKQLRDNSIFPSTLTETNFANWNINIHGLRITFDEATVAPYAFGPKTVLVPYSVLKEMINPDTVLGECLKHRKRCMQDPLLTGGFIDEAANTKHHRLNPAFG